MSKVVVMKVLFLLSLASKAALMPMVGHWIIIMAMLLIEAPIEWAADYTLFGTVVLAVGSLLVVTAFNRDGRVSDRMRRGPGDLLRYFVPTLLAAMASSVGGVMLLSINAGGAAHWAMGLGAFVAVCETSALLGSMYLDALGSPKTGR